MHSVPASAPESADSQGVSAGIPCHVAGMVAKFGMTMQVRIIDGRGGEMQKIL